MQLLLDTHALLWWLLDDAQMSPAARTAIGNESHAVFISAASAWELATKHSLGKLGEAGEVVDRYDELVAANAFTHLPITHLHSLKAGQYAVEHRDPFDRMLAAQSDLEGLVLVTRDPVFTHWEPNNGERQPDAAARRARPVEGRPGLYISASEVVREALRLMEAEDRLREARLEHLRKRSTRKEEASKDGPEKRAGTRTNVGA